MFSFPPFFGRSGFKHKFNNCKKHNKGLAAAELLRTKHGSHPTKWSLVRLSQKQKQATWQKKEKNREKQMPTPQFQVLPTNKMCQRCPVFVLRSSNDSIFMIKACISHTDLSLI